MTPEPFTLINWQSGAIRETMRGKLKAVVYGIPGNAFFHAYRNRTAFRKEAQGLGITVKRLAKGQWEAICWINRHNACLFEPLGIEIPEIPQAALNLNQPF